MCLDAYKSVSMNRFRDILHSTLKFLVEICYFVLFFKLLAANLWVIFQFFSILISEWSVKIKEGKTKNNLFTFFAKTVLMVYNAETDNKISQLLLYFTFHTARIV